MKLLFCLVLGVSSMSLGAQERQVTEEKADIGVSPMSLGAQERQKRVRELPTVSSLTSQEKYQERQVEEVAESVFSIIPALANMCERRKKGEDRGYLVTLTLADICEGMKNEKIKKIDINELVDVLMSDEYLSLWHTCLTKKALSRYKEKKLSYGIHFSNAGKSFLRFLTESDFTSCNQIAFLQYLKGLGALKDLGEEDYL